MKTKVNRFQIDQYQRDKKTLKAGFHFISDQVFFEKMLLPEFIWLSYLRDYYGEIRSFHELSRFSNVIDRYYAPKLNNFFDGTISSFRVVKGENRLKFLSENKELVEDLIIKPFGVVIALYPQIPMKWLLNNKKYTSISQEYIKDLEQKIRVLQDSKSDYTGNIRAMPFNQILKHGKVHFNSQMKETIEAVKNYPEGDRYRLQTMARSIFNLVKQNHREKSKWPAYFWDYNIKIVKCDE